MKSLCATASVGLLSLGDFLIFCHAMLKKIKVSADETPPVFPLGELTDYYIKDGLAVFPFAHDRRDCRNEVEYDGVWQIFVPGDFPFEVWERIQVATRENKLGKKSEVRFNGDESDSSKFICVYVCDWTDKEEVARVKDELTKLGVMTNEMSFVRIKRKTDEEKYDEMMKRTYGPVLPRYREIIRQAIRDSGILQTLRDQAALEKFLLSIMTLYPGGFDSPIRQKEIFRETANEFKEHAPDIEKLIRNLREVQEIAIKLLYTRIRSPQEKAFTIRMREAKSGDSMEKHLCCLCNHPLEVVYVDKEKNRVGVVCPKFKEDGDERHTHDTWIGLSGSPRDQGIFFDIADMVLQRLEGLNDAISANYQEKREALMRRGRSPDYYNAWIVTQMVDAVKKYSTADLPKEKAKKFVSQLINKWPKWKGRKIGRKAVEQKQKLMLEKK